MALSAVICHAGQSWYLFAFCLLNFLIVVGHSTSGVASRILDSGVLNETKGRI